MKNLFFVVIVFLAFWSCNRAEDRKSVTNDGEVFVGVEEAYIGRIANTLNIQGVLEPIQSVRLSTQLSAQVISIAVEKGDKVRKGQVLAQMSRSNLNQAAAQLEAVRSEWHRIQTLYDAGSVSKAAYDRAKAQYEATLAAFEMAEDNTVLKAPFNGEVLDIGATEGEIFSPMMSMRGAPYIVHVINDDTLKMDITIPDRHINNIRAGNVVHFIADAINDTLVGFVHQVNRSADPTSGAFSGTVHLPNTKQKTPSGIYAEARIVIEQADSALIVPQNAVIGDTLVFVVKDGKSHHIKIETGIQTVNEVQILTNDLKAGDKVITQGNIGLRSGLAVMIVE